MLVCALCCVACSDEPKRGQRGESCTAANDCGDGLLCIQLVCVSEAGGDAGVGTPDASLPSSSCEARRDCPSGSMCVANECQPVSDGTSTSTRYSGRGESCQAKNDCEPELSCVMGMCREDGLTLPHLEKSCYRVECESRDDCCATFVPNPNCETYRQNCETDPIFCNTYRSLCECALDCKDELCVAAQPGCMSDAECTSSQTPFCVEGKCSQCNRDETCPGGGAKCSAGVCMAACTTDANCPLLYACVDSTCVETGCQSDRECAFITKNARAVCRDSKCESPCQADADCIANDRTATGFEVCQDAQCRFVGCESDSECRALLNLAAVPGKVRAVCR
ncbi:MAG: hypothetical protein ABW321_31335 [Polyangiales bacterium]